MTGMNIRYRWDALNSNGGLLYATLSSTFQAAICGFFNRNTQLITDSWGQRKINH
jgi:hypothetical protein